MDPTTVNLLFEVELDAAYDPFKGKTIRQYAEAIEDDLQQAILDLRPEVKNIYTAVKDIQEYDD